jgi:hypothetical protein
MDAQRFVTDDVGIVVRQFDSQKFGNAPSGMNVTEEFD